MICNKCNIRCSRSQHTEFINNYVSIITSFQENRSGKPYQKIFAAADDII